MEHDRRALALSADALVAWPLPFYIGGPADVEEHFKHSPPELDAPLFAYDIPVCVHTKLSWKMLARLGAEGVLAGVKDSSGDDVSFRYLVQENEERSSSALLTGHGC